MTALSLHRSLPSVSTRDMALSRQLLAALIGSVITVIAIGVVQFFLWNDAVTSVRAASGLAFDEIALRQIPYELSWVPRARRSCKEEVFTPEQCDAMTATLGRMYLAPESQVRDILARRAAVVDAAALGVDPMWPLSLGRPALVPLRSFLLL